MPIMPGPIILLYTEYTLVMNELIEQFIQEWRLHCMGPIIVIYIIYANIVWAHSKVYMQSMFALHGPIMYS